MKKIGLLIPTLNSGGAERVVSRLSKILSDKYKVYLILFEDTYIDYEYDGELINMNIKSSKFLIKQLILPFLRKKELKKIKKRLDLDVVISFLDGPNIVNILSKTKNCKTVISIRNYTFREEKQDIKAKITSKIMGRLYNKADKIVSVSNVIKESLKNKYKIDDNKLEVIYNPYNYDEIKEMTLEPIEKEYQEIFKYKTFISVGRMMHQKGFWHLIKAFKLVKEENKEVKLVIIGNDFQNGKVKKLIDEFKLNNDIILLGYQKNPFKYISRSYAYVMPSLFEGFPNSLVEAMNCGIPVISTDCLSGPREILDDEDNINKKTIDIEYATYGILIKDLEEKENWKKDVVEEGDRILSKVMNEILNDKNLYLKYKKSVSERGKSFSYEKCKERFTKLIEEITS